MLLAMLVFLSNSTNYVHLVKKKKTRFNSVMSGNFRGRTVSSPLIFTSSGFQRSLSSYLSRSWHIFCFVTGPLLGMTCKLFRFVVLIFSKDWVQPLKINRSPARPSSMSNYTGETVFMWSAWRTGVFQIMPKKMLA